MKRRKLIKLLIGSVVPVVMTACSTETTIDTSMFDSAKADTGNSSLPNCPTWDNAIAADNVADIPKIQQLGYEVAHCNRFISEADSRPKVEVVLVKVANVSTSDSSEFANKQVQIQEAVIAALKKHNIPAKSAGVG